VKRDLDLIRTILIAVESGDPKAELPCTQEEFAYHAALLKDAGLIEGAVALDNKGQPRAAHITRLTWTGHEFLDAARNDTVWNAAKDKFLKPGASWTFSIVLDWLKGEALRFLSGGGPPQLP
jgi:hypothetical protein